MTSVMNKLSIVALTALLITVPRTAAFAATDHGGFGQDLFTNQAPGGLQDPSDLTASAQPDGSAVAGIEPAAGDAMPGAAATAGTQNVEAVVIPDYDAVDASTTGDGKTNR